MSIPFVQPFLYFNISLLTYQELTRRSCRNDNATTGMMDMH